MKHNTRIFSGGKELYCSLTCLLLTCKVLISLSARQTNIADWDKLQNTQH